ncbi:carboxypeptidase-like regulatory domain-containing protein [Methanosarcina sp. T3]|uniref:carboxypeptidase-like regulatory domain-containing protein n=1 Tax=Methanosarcina sp. T3 TaxID=3439062 RepID=UPI003F852BC6
MERGSIAGRVTNANNEPVVDAMVMVTGRSPSHRDIASVTDERGEYILDELIPGDYEILVNSESHGIQTRQTHVEAGIVTRLNFSFIR